MAKIEHLSSLKSFIRILNSSDIACLFVLGPPGLGKSHCTTAALKSLKIPYDLITSFSTPLALYNSVVRSPNKLKVLDDTSGVLETEAGLSLCKALCWPTVGGKRIVTWNS